MPEQSKDSLAPELIPIPDEVREFLEVVHILVGRLERGIFKWEDEYCWDNIYWSKGLIFTTGMVCVLCDGCEAEFEVRYSARFAGGKTEWEFAVSREELARIADGTAGHLALHGCANPVCGYKSSRRQEQCPRCHLESGVEIGKCQSQRVLGICPYCHKLLRTLYAQQCHHCKMDWHDPNHPTKLGANF